MRGFRFFLAVSLLSFLLPSMAPKVHAQQSITLGNATAALTGPWKFHIGDNMAWAQPDFDDSAWGTMDLTPPPGSYDPAFGNSGFVPGWTARGYKGYSGYAWYRLRVNIQDGQSTLALKMPDDFDDAYQVYVNGRLIGQFGRFTAHGVTAYLDQPRAFPLPANLRSGSAAIAIRMYMEHSTALIELDTGGLHGPPVLGKAAVVKGLLHLDWDVIDRSSYSLFAEMAILLLALLVAFSLFWLDPAEPGYLWLGLICADILALNVLSVGGTYTTWIDGGLVFLLEDAVLIPAAIALWVLFWAYWFRLDGMAQLHRIVWGLAVLMGVGAAMLRAPLYGTFVPVRSKVWLMPLTDTLHGLLGLLLVWVAVRGIRKNKAEGWLALPALILVAITQYSQALLDFLHVRSSFFVAGTFIGVGQIGTILSLVIITVLLLRRFLRSQREREQWRLEIEQAKQVQQMLIPEALPVIPGFTLESEYRPAQHVGGDFFQIIEGDDDSVLIVLGDVSGKGLKAAMLVSLIVGTIRTLAKFTRDPMEVLRGLNERLCGRMQGHFATCVVAHIAPDGETTIANAGHLAPYLNGQEAAIAGSLPLGLIETAEFEQTRFTLEPGDRLTLLTDGIVEAQNEKRELFGFARTNDLMQQDKSAVEIAATAQAFGQEDDITVLRMVRAAAEMAETASTFSRSC